MALPIGKLAVLIGAGFVGSVFVKESGASGIKDILSGAFKGIKQDDKPLKDDKPRSDSLLAQVNSLRQELQMLASSRPVTIVTTTTGSGISKYGVIVLVVVAGYGYIWWKVQSHAERKRLHQSRGQKEETVDNQMNNSGWK